MSDILEKLEHDALCLSRQERAFLADRLLSSLDGDALTEVDEAWVVDAEHRYQEYKEDNYLGSLRRRIFSPILEGDP